MTESAPIRSTKGKFPSLNIDESATIGQNIYYSGSINIEPGSGIIFDGKVMSATGGAATIAGVVAINNQTGTIVMNAGPGLSVNNSNGTIQFVNEGTLVPGNGIVIIDGTIASTITQGISSLIAGPGISVDGSTITNTGTLTPGSGIQIGGGTIASTITGGSASIYAGNNIQVGGSTVSVVENPVFQQITVSTINMTGFPVFDTDVITGFVFQLHGTQVMGIANNVNYNDLGGILSIGTLNAVRINAPAIPIGSGLAEASGTIYATGGASTGTVSAYEVLSPSNTLAFAVTTSQSGTVTSSTISIVNAKSTASPTPFQQYVSIDFSTGNLHTYANATLTNIQFSDLSGATIIPSWRESGTVNAGTSIYWLKLSQGIPASSTLYVKMNFFTNKQSVLNSTDTGIAPQLPLYYGGAYGSNDTGTIVFVTSSGTLYDNFAGTVFSPLWYTTTTGATLAFNEGVTATIGTLTNDQYLISSSLTAVSSAMVAEGRINTNSFNTGYYRLGVISLTETNTIVPTFDVSNNENAIGWIGDIKADYAIAGGVTSSGTTNEDITSTIISDSDYHVFGIEYPDNGSAGFYYDYTNEGTIATGLPSAPFYLTFSNIMTSGHNTPYMQYNIQWARTRAYPPSGQMPSANTSTLVNIESVIVFPAGASYVNGPSEAPPLFLSLSAYGIANTSTCLTNNCGFDYGPDTPNTTTVGWQEAITKVFDNGGGRLFVKNGPYNLTGGFQSGTESGNAQILVPYNYPGNPMITIEIEGENPPDFWKYQNLPTPTVPPVATVGVPVIVSTLGGSGTYPAVFGCDGNETGSGQSVRQGLLSNVHIIMKNIGVRTIENPNLKGIDLRNIAGYELDNVSVEAATSGGTLVVQPTSTLGIGIQGSGSGNDTVSAAFGGIGYNDGLQVMNNIYVQGFYYGVLPGEHTLGDNIFIQYCNSGIAPNVAVEAHGMYFKRIDLENNLYGIDDSLLSSTCYFHVSNYESGGSTSPWTNVMFKNTTGWLKGDVMLDNSTTETLYSDSSKLFPNGLRIINISQYPTIQVNSATIALSTTYQNTQPYDTQVTVPVVFNPTSSESATVQAFISKNTTLQGLPYEVMPAGVTAGAIRNLTFNVPAGWYYAVDGINITLETLTIAPI